jgi:hypothetical protein
MQVRNYLILLYFDVANFQPRRLRQFSGQGILLTLTGAWLLGIAQREPPQA